MPGHFGLGTPRALTMAMYHGRVSQRRIGELSPVVFAAAMEGDEAARAIVDRLADEVVAMAGAMMRRLRLARTDPEVVLGGGVFRTADEAFRLRIEAGVQAIARRARLVRTKAPPVAGAALLGLDEVGGAIADPAVGAKLRVALASWDAKTLDSASNGG